jgi:hypothetical protein
LKPSVFWDITPCSQLKINQHFGGTFRLNLQVIKVSEIINQHETGKQADQILASLIFPP